ncbi:putative transcription factor hes-1 [Operophtera brumata]|uniref:Putative transcription factor hes-1 n=1 Tax=Operophtera brumata TaxID=104452 RepID=A0A0L7KU65_OPEBR|nr:putative transcription factor hes-1 [Operophtera brumata]
MPCSEDDDSQSGFGESQGLSKAELRKTNKPIMEKKRRARINNCLNELKDLLIDTDKDPARHSKLEKADILELAVKHLQKLQRQQLAAAIAADPAVLHRFKSGFGDCAVEVRRYLSRLASVPTALRHRIGNHLTNCVAGMDRMHPDYPPLVPDPLRLDDERPSAFHFVRATKPTSPPLSPLSCDSACDSSTELETPPRPVQILPFPTPPSRSASDQDSSPETQKPTVSSTTISPESLKQDGRLKVMEPLSIVIDVENYKIGIDASPKRAVDYSMRQKLKRPVVEMTGPAPKMMRLEPDRETLKVRLQPEVFPKEPLHLYVEKPSAFRRVQERAIYERPSILPASQERLNILTQSQEIPHILPQSQDRLRILPPSQEIPHILPLLHEIPSILPLHDQRLVPRSVISHTAQSLAQPTSKNEHKTEANTSPEQGPSSSTEMWRPW